jgi:FkbM family methyltransferase
MSVLFSEMVGDNGIVYSFEADDFVFKILKKNIDANSCKNIVSVFGAVFNESGKELFFPKQDFERFLSYGSYGIDPQANSGRKVKSIRIDDIEFSLPISFMKVDVQGSDLFAMQGAKETIRKHRMPILFEFEQQFQDEFETSFQDYVEFVDSIDYKFSEVVNQINYLITPK